MQLMVWSVRSTSDGTLPTVYRLYQAAEQSEVGAVWKVVEEDSETDSEDFGVVEEDDVVEDDFAEDPRSEAVHRLPCLSPLSNVHADLSPSKL
jgi:hypothetical protein